METDRQETLAERSDLIERRRSELDARLLRITSGNPSTALDVKAARAALANARSLSADAHDRTADALRGAALAHRQVADVAERLGQHQRATEYRMAAEADFASAARHEQAAELDRAAAKDTARRDPTTS